MLDRVIKPFRRLLREDHGGEVLEYALVVGLLIVGAIAVLVTFSAAPAKLWKETQEEYAKGAPQ